MAIERFGGRALLADEPGCVDGDAVVHVNRCGRGFSIKLSELFYKFHGGVSGKGRKSWDLSKPTMIRSLCGSEFHLNRVNNVVHRGVKNVLEITTRSGKTIRVTPDHEIAGPNGSWTEARYLRVGDTILTNGRPKCRECGSTKNISTYPYARFRGFCKKCIYRKFRKKPTWKGGKSLDKDGYVRVSGQQDHPRAKGGTVCEHILVMEKAIGRYVTKNECVHHNNGVKDDNRIENLTLMSKSEHMAYHGRGGGYRRLHGATSANGGIVTFIPREDEITKIVPAGKVRVFDVVCDDPHRNFVANGVVVHNCGKSLTVWLWAYRNSDLWPVVIVCPATLKWNWLGEIKTHFGMDATVLESRKAQPLDGERHLIINYDILTNRKGQGWLKELKRIRPKVIILDESHFLSNRATLRTKAVRLLCVGVPHVIALTGTPVTKRPVDIWPTLNILRPKIFRSFRAFAEEFNPPEATPWGVVYNTPTNTKKLNRLLRETCLIRRRKKDVLKELPALTRSMVPLDMEREGEYRKAQQEFLRWLHEKCPKKARKAARAQQIVKVGYLKRLAAELKLRSAVQWVHDFLETGQKLVLFGIHKNILSAFAGAFWETCVVVDGSVTGKARQEAVDEFQTNKHVNLFVGNIKAAGVGITLTAASAVALVELPWTPADCQQAEKRCDRMGQRNAVTAYYLVAKDSLEVRLCEILQERARVIGDIIDGGGGADDLNILDLLVEELEK